MNIKLLSAPTKKKQKPTVSLRPFPYPYRAALSLLVDIRSCSAEQATRLMQVLCLDDKVRYGQGFGLELSATLPIWADNANHVSLLEPDDNLSKLAPGFAELAQDGWVDSICATIPPASNPKFNRERAATIYKSLENAAIHLEIWLNENEQNFTNANLAQNFYSRKNKNFIGDIPNGEHYHLDFAKNYGIRYYWWNEEMEFPLSAEKPDFKNIRARRFSMNLANIGRLLSLGFHKLQSARSISDLAIPLMMRDRRKIFAFSTFNLKPNAANFKLDQNSLREQLSQRFLSKLLNWQGYAIIPVSINGEAFSGDGSLLSGYDMAALNRLKSLSDDGEIMIATTQRLLDYWQIYHYLDWDFEQKSNGEYLINIKGVSDPVLGNRIPNERELMGISFYSPAPERTKVEMAGRTIASFMPFGTDFTGRKGGVYLPWYRLPSPSNRFELKPSRIGYN